MAASARILTVRIKPGEDGTTVLAEYGNVELERKIAENYGVTRMSVIFDATGTLSDMELVVEKVN